MKKVIIFGMIITGLIAYEPPRSTNAPKSTDAPKSIRKEGIRLSKDQEDLILRKLAYFKVMEDFTSCIRKAGSDKELDLCEEDLRKK